MIINATSNTNRSEILEQEYLKLLSNGVNPENILVLVQNPLKKNKFIEYIKKNSPLGFVGNLKIYSFYGLIYNYILENWAIVENSIKDNKGKIIPNMSGLEISQYILKECIREVDFTGYNSKTSLLHQLLRRISLINLNDLSEEEVNKRSLILGESFGISAKEAINKYKKKTIDLRSFDYIRQMNLFKFLYQKLKNNFEYVFLDDGDEIVPALLTYLEYIKPSVKQFYIGYDYLGSSRLGYLGAINIDFEKLLGEKALKVEENNLKTNNAKNILDNIRQDKPVELDNIKTKSFLKRNEMIDCVIEDITKLINKGIKPSDISVITPLCDEFLKNSFEKTGFNFTFLTKNEKLNQNKLISYILELLKIINDKDNSDISPYVLKGIFIGLLGFEPSKSIQILQEYKLERDFKNTNLFDFIKDKEDFSALSELYQKIRFEKLSEQFYEIVNTFVPPKKEIAHDIIKINQILKQITDFEEVFDNVSNPELITQLENTIISENPLSDDEIDENSIIVSSAQKIIDYSYKTKYQLYLDISSENWLKQDIGPLYNAWVMQKKWSKDTFELEDNIELTKDRTARMLYKLYLLGDNITLYSSVYDTLGIENFSGIDKYFKSNVILENKQAKPITPRSDQQAVLDYKGGLMSVSATAGSGKTTIMLLLVDKLLSNGIIKGIEPKNIFVLTFMESAARNFKERIKSRFPDLTELPNISTIHGLALRIIKENNNYSKIGLDYDFEIIDDIKRANFLGEICIKYSVTSDKVDLYDRAISTYKNEIALYPDYKNENRLFLNIYQGYQEKLKEENLIDYDDLLLLSLKLLRENKDVLDYYQDLAQIVIEDEAQDSSFVQQSLIKLLSGKHKNVIRCGDINQAITSTFTNSDVRGFRDFIGNSFNVVMDRCQRCATGVLDCANKTVEIAHNNKIDAFSSLIMKPVENINIVDKNAVKVDIFEDERTENEKIILNIQNILKQDKEATVAILVRNNFQITKWDNLLKDNFIKTYKNSDSLINNPLYKTVLLVLKFIVNPYDLKIVAQIAKELYEMGYYKYESLKYANSLTKPIFLMQDFDEPLYWDLTYFLFKNHYNIYDLVLDIGNIYFSKTSQNVNIALVCAICQKVRNSAKTFEDTVLRLDQIQNKTNFSNIKFFSAEDNSIKSSKVQIMTLHKSKGDEFDYVFIPELTKENLCLSSDEYKLKENSKFNQKFKYIKKTDDELKREIIEENYRLIYVGITRAKKKLYLSSAQKYKYYSKVKEFETSEILEELS